MPLIGHRQINITLQRSHINLFMSRIPLVHLVKNWAARNEWSHRECEKFTILNTCLHSLFKIQSNDVKRKEKFQKEMNQFFKYPINLRHNVVPYSITRSLEKLLLILLKLLSSPVHCILLKSVWRFCVSPSGEISISK